MIVGVLFIIIGVGLMSLSSSIAGGFTSADTHLVNGHYESTVITVSAGDTLTLESSNYAYLFPSNAFIPTTNTTAESLQIKPTATASLGSGFSESWIGLNGTYIFVIFSHAAIKAEYEVMTQNSEQGVFSSAIAVMMGAILFIVGLISVLLGIAIRKKKVGSNAGAVTRQGDNDSNRNFKE